MTRQLLACCFAVLFALPLAAANDDWKTVAPGVAYREFLSDHSDIHVARIDLSNDALEVISTPEPYRGTTVSDFAQKTKAIVVTNGDYFDAKFNPRGLMINPCDQWTGAKDNPMHESVVAVMNRHAAVEPQSAFRAAAENVTTAVSGWPVLVKNCTALGSKELPGSDAFTRTPLPRTAIGLTDDGSTMYLVVADGRRTGIPGLTLADLAQFMADQLSVCSAVNLDGGGSSAMWVGDRVVNRPSDGVERRVGDHVAVVLKSDAACPPAVTQTASTKTTITTTVTTTTTTTQAPMTSATPTTSTAPATTTMPATSTAPPRR